MIPARDQPRLQAIRATRDWAAATRGVTEPEMIVAESAHAAVDKAVRLCRRAPNPQICDAPSSLMLSSLCGALSSEYLCLVSPLSRRRISTSGWFGCLWTRISSERLAAPHAFRYPTATRVWSGCSCARSSPCRAFSLPIGWTSTL